MGAGGRVATRLWTGRSRAARVARTALAPAAAAYGVVVAVRNRLYDRGWLAAARVPARVVSVGNLVVGGTGKTPAALWLAEAFRSRGRRVAIVARGYGKQRRGVVVVGDGARVLVPAEVGGDEAVLLARRFGGPVVTAERRVDAAAEAVRRFGVDMIVLDDGFQHRALARDADLVLLRDGTGVRLLPAGPGREPAASLARATAALVVGEGDFPVPPRLPDGPRSFRGRMLPGGLVRARDGIWSEEPASALRGREVIAAAGIAHPERLAASLTALGARVVRLEAFADHHVYGARDLARLAAADRLLVTTEKDLVKLAGRVGGVEVVALRVVLDVEDGDALVTLLLGG